MPFRRFAVNLPSELISSSGLPKIIPTENVPVFLFSSQDVEEEALLQLKSLARSVIPVGYVSAMPGKYSAFFLFILIIAVSFCFFIFGLDVHVGKGATVGTVFASEKYIVPNAVGVDIGCGISAIPLNDLVKDDLKPDLQRKIFSSIKTLIPTGFGCNKDTTKDLEKRFADLSKEHPPSPWLASQLKGEYASRVLHQVGSLGGGNHFIEVVYDENDRIWVMLHSGSRFIGKHTAEYYDKIAKKQLADSVGKNATPEVINAFLFLPFFVTHFLLSFFVFLFSISMLCPCLSSF
jgi:tRNA-splicing ligase RtcB